MEEIKLFPNVCEAVRAMKRCCGDNGTPIAQSEVYNETWLLRMVLSCIHDYSGSFNGCRTEIHDALTRIKDAVRVRWISEGGLQPTLEREGTTWADAIVGPVKIHDDIDNEIDSETKRGIILDGNDKHVGVVVIEAKVGSKLSEGTRNYANYNQAARNMACLAKLVMHEPDDFIKKCAFVVFGPRDAIKSKSWKGQEWNQQQLLTKAIDVIKDKHSNGETRKYIKDKDLFFKAAGLIAKASIVVAWEDVVESIDNMELTNFYNAVLAENKADIY